MRSAVSSSLKEATGINVSTGPVSHDVQIIEGVPGEDGEPGVPGPPGPPGPPGGSFVHVQITPAAVWTITHDLGYYANVTVVDTQGEQCEGEVEYGPMGTIIVTFSAGFAGTAYLS